MLSPRRESPELEIRDIDSMARAVFTWVRQQAMEQRFLGVPVSETEQLELAAGFLAGLRARLGLCDTETTIVAYVYALMRGDRAEAANAAEQLISREPGMNVSCAGYLHGLDAARRLLTEQPVTASRDTTEETAAPFGADNSLLN